MTIGSPGTSAPASRAPARSAGPSGIASRGRRRRRARPSFPRGPDAVAAVPADAEQDDLGWKPAALEHRHRGRDAPKTRLLVARWMCESVGMRRDVTVEVSAA